MILGKRKAVAVLAATAIVGSGAMWAVPAHAATNCVPVPGGTLGADVKVGPVEERVPAISDIEICVGGGTVPLTRVATSGGSCVSGCLAVYVGGGAVDLDGFSISWSEDGVPHAPVGLDPTPISGPAETCVLSVGMPDAPDTDCFIAIGPDDPTGTLQPIVDDAFEAIGTAVGLVGTGERITCDLIPDWYDSNTGTYRDFCTDEVGWSLAVANDGEDVTCNSLPPMYDDWGREYRFCDNPTGWLNAFVDDGYETCNYALGPQTDPDYPYWWDEVYFCDDPVLWTERAIENLCNNLCDLQTLQVLIARIREITQEEIRIHIG
ncbi:MAG TPA: hypothetical protein VEU29_03625 [Actinomycetota bacterium]|nr:hypothetical protein [Actinomycetota bacterium]